MPKISNTIDYSKTPISFYRFCCKDVNIFSSYVGHTANFRQRKCEHKSRCNNPNSKKYNYKIYQTIRNNGGWDNWQMIEIESKICLSKRDAERQEQIITEKLNANMNMKKAFGAENKTEYGKQYYQENKEERKQYQKQYYDEHQEAIKQYRDNHQEEQKQYRDEHQEEMKQYQKQYYDEHRQQINKQIKCECGCDTTKINLSRHKKSKKHINLMCVTI